MSPRGIARVNPTKPRIRVMGKPCKMRGKTSIATVGEKNTRVKANDSHHSTKLAHIPTELNRALTAHIPPKLITGKKDAPTQHSEE